MTQSKIRTRALPLMVACAFLAACGGSSKVGELNGNGRAELLSIEVGRVVDVYAYQRASEDPSGGTGDRRVRTSRRLVRIAKDVVVNAGISTQSLFDASGNAVATANYEFLPFNKTVGHGELVILWDNRKGPESANFDAALAAAQQGLTAVPASYRGQNTATRPIPVVPRDAAIKLTFSASLDSTLDFFAANPSAIQLLEFKGDPAVVDPVNAFRVLPYRVIPQGKTIILDTTIQGGEVGIGGISSGLPLSSDNVTANIRLAIPARGQIVPTFYVREDNVAALNSVDSAGRSSVIRDFRSGNLADGAAGRLSDAERPMIEGSIAMDLVAVDSVNNILTLTKRDRFVPVRGRYPFVDGPLDATGVPLGPLSVPTTKALPHGDFITQDVRITNSQGALEIVSLRAEVLYNQEIGHQVGQPLGLAIDTPPTGDSGQGELIETIHVRVTSVAPGVDSDGNKIAFAPSLYPEEGCTVKALYYDNVPFSSSSAVLTDAGWRSNFLRIEPKPPQGSSGTQTDVAPSSSIAVEFTKPMDLDQVDNTANLVITNGADYAPLSAGSSFSRTMSDPKLAGLRVVPTRLSDLTGDGTVLRLQPPMGFFHRAGQSEAFTVHVQLGAAGVTDFAGNTLQIFEDQNAATPVQAWSVDFTLAPTANDNLVGWYAMLFGAEDGDGSLPGSVDMFGQFRLQGGRLIGASGVRLSRSADRQTLSAISRINRGECWDDRDVGPTPNTQIIPVPGPPAGVVPVDPATGAPHPGLLYWAPFMSDSIGPNPPAPQVYEYWQTVPQPVGRVVEPLKPQGSRMQMRYLEDDFNLSYRQASEFALDVEQLYWAPFNDETVRYDVFDRFTMSLAHGRSRPDERWLLVYDDPDPTIANAFCTMDCASMNSGLSTLFSDNVLEGSAQVPVFADKVYKVNPNEAFRTIEQVKFVPYPRFDRSYTWRDSRLVTVDASGLVIGLGGAINPNAVPPSNDTTAAIDSPWITGTPDPEFVSAGGAIWTRDVADFDGLNARDHDPIALPLLVDMKMFADDAANGIASGHNGFQVALLGPPSAGFPAAPGGYYDQVASGCGGGFQPWPHLRVHASGGFDLLNGQPITVDPANVTQAVPSVVKDAGLGAATTALFTAPAGDGMLHWARADFVRKVSTMTFGFFDSLQPQRYSILNFDENGVPLGIASGVGFPNLAAASLPNLRISDLLVQMDPPQARQPAGTSVVVELRGADSFNSDSVLYNPTFDQFGATPDDNYDTRGNLLNANYACEAYRYSQANLPGGNVRVVANGLTRYVTDDQLGLIRNNGTGLLPRFLNARVVMTNNVSVTPALSPSLRSLSFVYRLQESL